MNLNNMDCWITQELLDEDRLDAYYYSKKFIDLEKHILKTVAKTKKVNEIYKVLDGDHGSVEYSSNGVAFLRAQNIMDGYIDYENIVYITESQHKKSKRSMIYKEDLLLSIMASTGVSAVFSKDILCNANRAVGILRNNNKDFIDNHYVVALINSNIGKIIFDRGIRGSIQKRLNLADINDLIIPIPSTEIQKYIGDKVRKAEELREEAKILKKDAEDILYKELREEEFLEKQKTIINKFIWLNNKDMETRIDSEYYKPNYILYKHILKKSGIRTLPIKDIVKDIKTGTTPESKFITQEKQSIKFLKVNNLDYCFLNEDDLLYIDNNYEEKKLRFLQQEDILVSIAGTLGRSAVIDTNNCTTNQNIASLTLKNASDIRPYYLSMYFNSYFGNLALDTISTQATVKYINNELLGDIEIPIIKIDTQILIENKIIEHKNKLNNSKQLIQEAKQAIEDLIEGNFDLSKIKETN